MRTKAMALLAVTALAAGCGGNSPTRPASSLGVNPGSAYSTQIATPPPGSYVSTDSAFVAPPITTGLTSGATDSSAIGSTVPGTTSATDSVVPGVALPATDSTVPVVSPSLAPLPLGTLPPTTVPTPPPPAQPIAAPTAQPSPATAPGTLPPGVSYQVVKEWTTGWSLFGTKRAHVDLIVDYFPDSFFAPPANVIVQISWTKGGTTVNTTNYGPMTLAAPDSQEATFDAPVSSDGEQIQLLPAGN